MSGLCNCENNWCLTGSSVFPSQHCRATFMSWRLRCNAAIAGAENAAVTSSVVSASRFPLLKDQLGGDGIFHRYSCKKVTSMSTLVSGKLSLLVSVQVDPTKRFEHGGLFSVSGLCPVNDVSQLCEDLRLVTSQIHQQWQNSGQDVIIEKLTPERITSPDSTTAAFLLST